MNRFVCIHGHFYQPPRENAWLEAIEQQDSAYPYHDWNERITAECYAPNADSRILDEQDRIIRIVNNYADISFNIGPTLLAWMEAHAPDTYARVLEGDTRSRARFGGHGSALAQAYHHTILPLSNARDRRTQVLWGIRDFHHRFGRPPEGMWLPETAVDTATLEELAAHGIRFTVLAPHQASEARTLPDGGWQDVSGAQIDPTAPYLCRLPSGASIALFFYDGPVSRAVAFEDLLRNGERFARRVLSSLTPGDTPQLAHIATDGETYGHHHRHGEMALAYALHHIQDEGLATLTNYGEFLDRFPPRREVRIYDDTSWSCAHGVERWRSDCGCHTGGAPGWHQSWRAPLRDALDWLRDRLAPAFERAAAQHLRDPWAARDAYVDLLLDRSHAALDRFLAEHAIAPPRDADRVAILKLLEMQRHTMLMYTSCGWFFNDVAGIETIQVLQYAGRAVQLAEELFETPIEAAFLDLLEAARGNDPDLPDARRIYERKVKPAMVELTHVAAHYAVSSIFGGFEKRERVYCYTVELETHALRESGDARLSVGRARIVSDITAERATMTFAVLHFGGHNLSGGIRRLMDEEAYDLLAGKLIDAFAAGEFATLIQLLANVPEYTFSLRSLFADRQREILYHTLDESLRRAEDTYRRLYDENAGVMRYLIDLDLPLPRAFAMAAEFVINSELHAEFSSEMPNLNRARTLLEQARETHITLDGSGLGYAVRNTLERQVRAVLVAPYHVETLERLAELTALARSLPFPVDLWQVQNLFYHAVQKRFPAPALPARAGAAAPRHAPAAASAERPSDAPSRAQGADVGAAAAASTSSDEAWRRVARLAGEQLSVAVP